MDTEDALSTAMGVGIGVYLGAVVWNNQVTALGKLLYGEEKYIEFLVAIFIIQAIHGYAPASKISDAITILVIAGLLIKTAANVQVTAALSSFASGKLSMLDTVKQILGTKTQGI